MIKYVTLMVTFILGLTFGEAISEQRNWKWTVPAGVTKISVESRQGPKVVLDTVFNVKPGQRFLVEVVK